MISSGKELDRKNKNRKLIERFPGLTLEWEVTKLYSGKSKFFDILIGKNDFIGTFLALDNDIQSSEYDTHILHEMLVHTALATLEKPKDVLLIGDGEGAAIPEILKYDSVNKVEWVDIDKKLVRVCSRFLPYAWKGKDRRVRYTSCDGYKFITQQKIRKMKFDAIILDVTKLGKANKNELFTSHIISMLKSVLKKNGVVITVPRIFFPNNANDANANQIYKEFKYIRMVHFFLPSYMGVQRFIIASDRVDPYSIPKDKIKMRIKNFSSSLKYYDENCHHTSLAMTKDIILKNKYMRTYEK